MLQKSSVQQKKMQRVSSNLLRSSAALPFRPCQNHESNSKENIIVNDWHRPFCIPTKHNLATRNRETKTFPKSTYAFGDAGIPDESQRKLHLPE
jgi:hypothetical protein